MTAAHDDLDRKQRNITVRGDVKQQCRQLPQSHVCPQRWQVGCLLNLLDPRFEVRERLS